MTFKVGDKVMCLRGNWEGYIGVITHQTRIRFIGVPEGTYLSEGDGHHFDASLYKYRHLTPLEKLI